MHLRALVSILVTSTWAALVCTSAAGGSALPLEGAGTNLALGKPVTASGAEPNSDPEFAVDGDISLNQFWGASPPPQWLSVDLLSTANLDELNLWTYWDGNRSYRYTIDASLDGVQWDQVVDMSTNTVPSSPAGFAHATPGLAARYLRVNMLGNTANPGLHIVEFEAHGSFLPPGEIEIRPLGAFDFGNQEVYAGASAAEKLGIRNADGSNPLAIESVGIIGPGADEFLILSDTGEATLAPGASRVLNIAFDPSRTGTQKARILIRSNDSDEGSIEIPLKGFGDGELLSVIPQPAEIDVQGGTLNLSATSRIVVLDPSLQAHAAVLAAELELKSGLALAVSSGSPGTGDIVLGLDPALSGEAYTLDSSGPVDIRAGDVKSLTRGTASLIQVLEPDGSLPRVRLEDVPAFDYRALSLDVARKFHSIEVIQQTIELCRYYKIPYLGLHLTDDQNFMFPSAAFPDLDQNNFDQPAYTLAELQGLEAYAQARGIALIPELDVPGHSAKMVQIYPQVFGSLSGSTIDFQLPSCVAGVKTIIGEMLDVFPSTPYFHIGGDESGFSHLPAFPGFVTELNDLVRAGGRTTIMWEGFDSNTPIPTDIVVLNWESSYFPPDQMLQAGYTVVNAGWDPLYVVDHYPWVQYTYQSQERIYGFDPFTFGHVAPGYPASGGITVPATSAIPGAEMCWWEGRGHYAVPILRSRIPAFAARMWNPQDETSFASFEDRYTRANAGLESILFPVQVAAGGAYQDFWKPRQLFSGTANVRMGAEVAGTIRFTVDGSEPTAQSPEFATPLVLDATTVVSAALFRGSERLGFTTRIRFAQVQLVPGLTTGKAVRTSSATFPENPAELLVDGIVDNQSYWSTFPNPASVSIDLGQTKSIDGVTVHSRWGQGYFERYSIDLSTDGSTWTQVVDFTANSQPATGAGYVHAFSAVPARFIRLNTTSNSWFPAGRFPRIVEVQAHESL